MLQVRLNVGIPGGKWAVLRPLCGHDEALVDGSGWADVIAFLDRLLTDAPGTTVGPGRAADLAVCDCDQLCALIYLDYFGERVEGRITCGDCRGPFDMNFSLPEMLQKLEDHRSARAGGPNDDGVFTLGDGRRFRLPTAGQQRQVMRLDPDQAVAALLGRCLVEGEPTDHAEALEATMDQVGALIDLDLDATCPHCGAAQRVRFDIQSYLFRALGHERQFLNFEVHCIAMAYGWSYEEILSLNREDRRTYVRLIQSDRTAERRAQR